MAGRRLADKPQDWHDIVGMPDDLDLKNITALINNFKKDHFEVYGRVITGQQWITYEINDSREQNQLKIGQSSQSGNKYGMKIAETEVRIGTAMPYVLWNAIEAAYPTMFRDKAHFSWFVKHFPEFRVASTW